MLRILLFLGTNLAVIIVASITFQLLGLDRFLAAQGLDTNLTGLLIFCAIFGFGGAFVSLLLSKTMAKWSTGTRIIQQPGTVKEQWLVRTVEELAREAGIRTPDVGIFPSHASNAFATGWNKNSALVAVSEGLLARFGESEARAVLGHEISHVANGDMVTLTLIQGILNTFVIFFARIIGSLVDKAVFKNERGYGIGYFVVTIAAQIVLGILASMIVMWFSRFREFRADAGGAKLAGRQSMIDALNRLRQEQGMPGQMPETLQAFGIRPSIKHGLTKLFASHPPLELRIQALQRGA